MTAAPQVEERRSSQTRKWVQDSLPAIVPIAAAVVGLMIGLGLILLTGADLQSTFSSIWTGTLGQPYAMGITLNRIAILALVGVGFLLASRAGLFNIGGEGQIAVGGLATAAVALKLVGDLPSAVAIPMSLLAGAAAGAVFGGIAGVLRAYRGTNEVITTLLLNFIGVGMLALAVHEEGLLRQPVTDANTLPTTLPMPESTRLPLLFGPTSPANLGILITIVVLIAVWIAIKHGSLGVRLRAVGLGPGAAQRAGLDTARTQVLALSLSGSTAGLAGACMVLTTPFVLQEGFSSGYGFDGLVVGLIARGSVPGVVAGAALFGMMRSAGVSLEIGVGAPSETVMIIQALIVLAVAGSVVITRTRTRGELM